MNVAFWVNIIVPILAGLIYLILILEVHRVKKIRKIMFGEIGYNKMFLAFLLLGIYLVTRPLQNIIGPHPWPMIINSLRQFFLMAVIAPAILVGIFHWIPDKKSPPSKATMFAAYAVGFFMALIFILINFVGISGSRIVASIGNLKIYDPVWFAYGNTGMTLIFIHLISQFISPVGIILLAAGFVRHKRHTYTMKAIYNQMPTKWRYLEAGLIIFPVSMIIAGLAAFFGQYYTYLWVIYFIGAIIAGLVELRGIQLPPRASPADLR
ncbi:hypothetical protein ACFL58_03990 [Elusimicrobiota bacterium]